MRQDAVLELYAAKEPEDLKEFKGIVPSKGSQSTKTASKVNDTVVTAEDDDDVDASDKVGNMKAYITKSGGKHCVHSHQTGKNFGCYPTREGAKKRLKQMARFR